MANVVSELLGRIGAIQTLIENFPMSIFENSRGKVYTSTIEFVVDVLRQLGISEREILDELILLIFNVPNAVEIYNGVGNFTYRLINKPTDEQIAEAIVSAYKEIATIDDPMYIAVEVGIDGSGNTMYEYYSKQAPMISDELNSDFLKKLEESIKTVINGMLVGLLSCSIDPRIPARYLDTPINKANKTGLVIPKDLIDPFDLLSISPTNEIGRNFYNVDYDMYSTELYKSYDLNAFLWYVANRSSRMPQVEENKMVWDSRIFSKECGYSIRQNAEEWNAWYNSKKNDEIENDGIFYLKDNRDLYEEAYEDGVTEATPVYPILQFDKGGIDMTRGYVAYFPVQTYYNPALDRTKNIYQFNADYLSGIRILSPRIIICNMLDELLNSNLSLGLHLNISPKMQMIEAKLNSYIDKILEVDDTTITDCYYSFSNEDYEEMLRNNELKRYGAVSVGSETSPAMKIDPNYGLDAINEINSQATSNEKISTISKTVYEISTIPSQDPSVAANTNGGLLSNSEWLNNIVMALVRPIIRAIVSPQIMALFVIDFQVLGLINLEDKIMEDELEDLLFKRLMSVFVSIVRLIKDKIVEFLMELFYKNLEPLIISFYAIILLEQLNDWIKLLEEAIKCLPSFDFTRNRVFGQIDDVTYADITPTQDTPESTTGCE